MLVCLALNILYVVIQTTFGLSFGILYLHSFIVSQKENSKTKESKSPDKKVNKRKAAKKEPKPSKRPKTDWDSQNADSAAEYEVDFIIL